MGKYKTEDIAFAITILGVFAIVVMALLQPLLPILALIACTILSIIAVELDGIRNTLEQL